MSLKAYGFTRTNDKGDAENCYITFDSQSLSWDERGFYVSFKNYPSATAAGANIVKVGKDAPEKINPRDFFTLPLKGNNFMTQAMQPVISGDLPAMYAQIQSGEITLEMFLAIAGYPFLLFFSDRIWEMALNAPFIADYSEIDENGNFIGTLKSLTQLSAVKHDIDLS